MLPTCSRSTGPTRPRARPWPDRGYGQLCSVRKGDVPMTLEKLAARCTSVFSQVPRVWGDFDREIKSVATYTGSCGSIVAACLREHVDCLICGEVKYHAALDASAAGLAIIDMGHDTTELPFTGVLADAVAAAGALQIASSDDQKRQLVSSSNRPGCRIADVKRRNTREARGNNACRSKTKTFPRSSSYSTTTWSFFCPDIIAASSAAKDDCRCAQEDQGHR